MGTVTVHTLFNIVIYERIFKKNDLPTRVSISRLAEIIEYGHMVVDVLKLLSS